jgi:tetrahydromethanopterin S-methyltransferase subunit A
VDDNHFMGKLERTGNIAGVENVAKEVSRFVGSFGNIAGVENVAKEVSRFVGSFIFKKVKFVNKNDLKMMNSLSKKARRNLNYGAEEWPAIWTSVAMPTIIHQVSKRRSTVMQNVKKGLISGKHE